MTHERLRLDHVILGTRHLVATAERLRAGFGLASVDGGAYPDYPGVANRLVPVGPEQYVELLGIVDVDEAAQHPMGQGLLAVIPDEDRLLGWAVATDDIDAVAARLGVTPETWSIVLRDGTRGTWQTAGADVIVGEPSLPFFITYDARLTAAMDERWRRSLAAAGAVETKHIAWIAVDGDAGRVRERLAGVPLPVRCEAGPARVRAVGIATATGEVILR